MELLRKTNISVVGKYFLLAGVVLMVSHAQAQCAPNEACVTSFTITPGEIRGDTTGVAIGQATAYLLPNMNNEWVVAIGLGGVNFIGCLPPAITLNFACHVFGPTVSIQFSGTNSQPTPYLGNLIASAYGFHDQGISAPLTIDPVQANDPSQDPDAPCPDN